MFLTRLKDLDELNREFQDEIKEIKEIEQSKETEIKPLSELNREFQSELSEITQITEMTETSEVSEMTEITEMTVEKKKENKNKKKKRSIFALISDMLFYLAIFMVLVAILTSAPGNNNGKVRMFMGYSYFTVLSPSMQDEIPKGSFILVKKTDPKELKIGDNITFMKDANNSITHKITEIYENYENSGATAFQTKGVNNANPDKDIVYEANIVGKVVFVIPGAGAAISSLRENIYIVFIIFGLCILLSFLLRGLFGKTDKFDKIDDSVESVEHSKSSKSCKLSKQSESFEFTDSEWAEIEPLLKKYEITNIKT